MQITTVRRLYDCSRIESIAYTCAIRYGRDGLMLMQPAAAASTFVTVVSICFNERRRLELKIKIFALHLKQKRHHFHCRCIDRMHNFLFTTDQSYYPASLG